MKSYLMSSAMNDFLPISIGTSHFHVREFFRKYASVYWAARGPLVFPSLHIRKGMAVLDLGCNDGLVSRHLARQGAQVVGVDLDFEAVAIGKYHSETSREYGPIYGNASAEALPFANDSFDMVLCLDMLDIVPNDTVAVQELHRVLRPGGKLIITVMSQARRHTLVQLSFEEHIRNYLMDELETLLSQAGFKVLRVSTFYRRAGGLAREFGELVHRSGLGKILGINLVIDIVLSIVTRFDVFLPEDAGDGGFCIELERY